MILEVLRDSPSLQMMFYAFIVAGVIKSAMPVLRSWIENHKNDKTNK